MLNKNKISWSQLSKNTNGKASSSGFIGVILGLIGGVSFLGAMIGYFLQIPDTVAVMGQILALIAAATILLGVRKVSGNFAKPNDKNNETEI